MRCCQGLSNVRHLPENAAMQSLPARIRRSARVSGHFVLRSGAVSDTYFDKYQFEADPQLLLAIAEAMPSAVCRFGPCSASKR